LGKLKTAGFTLCGSKCLFGQSSITHLGFHYSAKGITPCKDKTKTIAKWPIPKTSKELQSFLGLANFYRSFVPGFANIAAPLNALTSNKSTFSWTSVHQSAFETLCHSFMSPPILDYPKQNDHFILTTDAFDKGLGAMLSTSRQTVTEFASRALTSTETKYTTSEKECLTVVWATHKFQHYILGNTFTLETDHKPLEWLESHKQSHAHSQRLERRSLELCAFDFNVTYHPAKDNQCADSLSRMPVSVVAWNDLSPHNRNFDAQEQDPILSVVRAQLAVDPNSAPTSPSWRNFSLRRYKQLWAQLTMIDSILYRVMKSPTMLELKKLIVTHSHYCTYFSRST